MGILSGIFGGGKKTTKVDQTKKEKVNSQQQQQQTQTSQTDKRGTSQVTGATTNRQTGTTGQTGKTQSVTGRQQVGSNQSTQRLFSDDILTDLEALVGQGNTGAGIGLEQLASVSAGAQDLLKNFDSEAFINSQVALGEQNFVDQILPQLRGFDSVVGGTAETNTVSNLLRQQAEGRQAVNQAAIKSDATVKANQIDLANLAAAGNAAGTLSQSTIPLLEQLKGALAVGQQETVQSGQETQTGQQETSSVSNQEGSSTSEQKQVTEELISALAEALATGTASQESTTNIKGTTTQKDTPSLFGALGQVVNLLGGIKGLNG